ncbi:amylo-alpha-1,6-glucosidase [Aliidongia dinghuensis]|uniref:Amylo-alpha-1,6-glucosidase n=1 Tax=Aliidongia dinghuensis TaxID=1867774 RepID=A0A8J2YX45_9PROT|nr:amylo-alpha-1,6-glucosidase [Aliidongia dinghuensis]GGF34814.1 amylo-alpha-1,6-glucosidase [Aliidongia dinghuensis]
MTTAPTALAAARPVASPYYIAATEAVSTQRLRVLKQGQAFAVLDDFGNAQALGPAAQGLFFEDTRYLAQLALTIDGVRPLLLSSYVAEDNDALMADLTNPDLAGGNGRAMAKDTVHILSTTVLGDDVLYQSLAVRNFGAEEAHFRLELNFAADFVDIFEVRGTSRTLRGDLLPDEQHAGGVTLGYRGRDGITRRTRLTFDPPSEAVAPRRAAWTLVLAPGDTRDIEIAVQCLRDGRRSEPPDRGACIAGAARHRRARQAQTTQIFTSNESFNNWLSRSRADLEMLITETPHGLYPYAGIPWFSTAFGRDGIITALQCLWLDPALAAGTLRFLAANQATELDAKADAEPGKILHETRHGEMAILGEVPFQRYYGGVDSTPLFVVLAAAYWRRTGDLALVRSIWPQIEAALGWMTSYGDPDGDGFLEYDRKSINGLINQGWKDSSDSIFHADGRLADAPIALAEVQAYAYAAYLGAADIAVQLDQPERAADLRDRAELLRQKFERTFWLDDLETYALALDGQKQPCRIGSSNAGHVLLGGLADPARAARVAERLVAPASFSHWGVRTIEGTAQRYNPMSYHNGSVWPHDNALIGMGFARYGLREPLLKVMSALFDASLFVADQRLPELFCGFERRAGSSPTAYPVACNPQAWSSATVFGLLGAVLGISFDPPGRQIRFIRPVLPAWMDECRLTDLRLGDAVVDLELRRHGEDVSLHVVKRTGAVEVVTVN